MRPARPAAAVIALVALALGRPPAARADEPAAETAVGGRVPLTANFPRAEQVGIGLVAAMDLTLVIFQRPIARRAGPPGLGDPWRWDREISDALYRGPGAGQLMGGLPDIGGMYVAPALALGWYGLQGTTTWLRGRSMTGGPGDHELLAFAEAYGLTVGVSQVAKFALGRERPYAALDRATGEEDEDEANLSFFSLHASSSFAIAAFVSRDVGDWLTSGPLRGRSAATRVIVGRVLPSVVLYGAATLVGYSRIVDQKHYFTDVVTGAVVGTVAGNVVYAWHFDAEGQPRRRWHRPELQLVAMPGGMGLAGVF